MGQFKHLRPLLLYHGRESYRKNSYLLFFSIYKNLLLSVPAILFNLYTGFSGEAVYDKWLVQLYNIAFTLLPVLMYAAFDIEYERESLVRNPGLYEDG